MFAFPAAEIISNYVGMMKAQPQRIKLIKWWLLLQDRAFCVPPAGVGQAVLLSVAKAAPQVRPPPPRLKKAQAELLGRRRQTRRETGFFCNLSSPGCQDWRAEWFAQGLEANLTLTGDVFLRSAGLGRLVASGKRRLGAAVKGGRIGPVFRIEGNAETPFGFRL